MNSVSSNYNMISNVSALQDAQVICLGECHIFESHRKNNAEIIDSLYKPGDIVLVEASYNNINVTKENDWGKQAEYVQSPISIKGWDSHEKDMTAIHYKIIENIFKCLISKEGAKKISAFALSLTGVGIFDSAYKTSYSSSSAVWVITAMFAALAFGNFSKIPVSNPVKATMSSRNRDMCKIIEENLLTGSDKKVFVIAGAAHFQPLLGEEPSLVETLEYLKTKKFAILIPNDWFTKLCFEIKV